MIPPSNSGKIQNHMEAAAFTLQPATQADESAIKTLIKEVNINPLSLQWRRFIVAVDAAGTMIGCGQIKPHKDQSYELASIAVKRPYRNQGVAKAIIKHLMEQQGPPLWLTCRSGLVDFYEPFGFQHITDLAEMPSYYRRVSRLFNLYKLFVREDRNEELAIMVWR